MPDVAMVNGALLYWSSWDPASPDEDDNVLTAGVADKRLDPPEAGLMTYPLGPGSGAGVDLLVRRAVFDAVGGFEERFRGMFEDQSFLFKVFLRYPVYFSSRYWILYRQHAASNAHAPGQPHTCAFEAASSTGSRTMPKNSMTPALTPQFGVRVGGSASAS